MKTSDKTASHFEEQLTQSAHRLRDKDNYELPLRRVPHRRFAWGWTTSAAAAVIGWIVGITFPVNKPLQPTEMAALTKTDTVIQYLEKVVRDTIVHEIKVPVKVEVPAEKRSNRTQNETVIGCNVECDGIDYALLVGK